MVTGRSIGSARRVFCGGLLQAILPPLTEPLGFPANKWEPVLGTIDPAQSLHTQETRIETFLDCFLR
jgi:hypothetical protein